MSYPCVRHLDDGIVHLIHTQLSPAQLQAHLAQALNERQAIVEPLLQSIASTPICAAVRIDKLFTLLADEWGATCALIFQQAVFSLQAEPAHLARHQPPAPEPLNQQIKRLCVVWAYGKLQIPDAPFFNAQLKAPSQAIWQQPAMQATLRHTTEQLRQSSLYGEWIDRYPTCWAYTFGALMHQLLQWNHRLTPAAVRALWPIEIAPHP